MAAIAANVSRLAISGFTYSFFMPRPQCRVKKVNAFTATRASGRLSQAQASMPCSALPIQRRINQPKEPDCALVTAVTADNLPDFVSSGFT